MARASTGLGIMAWCDHGWDDASQSMRDALSLSGDGPGNVAEYVSLALAAGKSPAFQKPGPMIREPIGPGLEPMD